MKYRKGDTVSIKGVVEYNQREDKDVFVRVHGHTHMISSEELTMVSPLFEVGDSVMWPAPNQPRSDVFQYGTILAIADDHAWISIGAGDYCTRLLFSIQRVEISENDPIS
jgi:hypothetical protein